MCRNGQDTETQMTPREFNRLPLLLTRAQLIAAGIPPKSISVLVAAGRLPGVRLTGPTGKRKYFKQSAAKILGLTEDHIQLHENHNAPP